MSEIIAVASAIGGVGKTTACINIGAAFAMDGKKVLLLDLNPMSPALDYQLNLRDQSVYKLSDVLEGACTIAKAFLKVPAYEGLTVIPVAHGNDFSRIPEGKLQKLLKVLSTGFDVLLLDLPAGLGKGFKMVEPLLTGLIFVTTQASLSLSSLEALTQELTDEMKSRSSVILNMYRPDLVKLHEMETWEESVKPLNLSVLGVVPRDEEIFLGTEAKEPVIDIHSAGCQAFVRIADRLQGDKIPVNPAKKR